MAAQTDIVGDMNVPQLMEDLSDVSDWYLLGSSLGLKPCQLNEIEINIPACDNAAQRRKMKVLDTWMRGKTDPSWRDIVTSLIKMGEQNIADEMRRKYSGSMAVISRPCAQADTRVEMMLKKNEQKIKGKFAKLQILVSSRLEEKQINMKHFVMFVRILFAPGSCIPLSSETIYEIFQIITDNRLWDYMNYSPIQTIVEEFGGNDSEIEVKLREYECSLCGFLVSTNVVDFIAHSDFFLNTSSSSTEVSSIRFDENYFKRLVIKLKYTPTELSVQYLIELWESFSRLWSLPNLPYLLDNIQPGSVVVTWLVPPRAVLILASTISRSETAKFYSKLGIIKVEVEDLYLYVEQESCMEPTTELKQEQDSEKKIQKETSDNVAKETREQEQDLDSKKKETSDNVAREQEQELSKHVGDPMIGLLEEILSMERKIQTRVEVENSRLKAAVAFKEVELGQLREQLVGLECKKTPEESQQLREQITEKAATLREDLAEMKLTAAAILRKHSRVSQQKMGGSSGDSKQQLLLIQTESSPAHHEMRDKDPPQSPHHPTHQQRPYMHEEADTGKKITTASSTDYTDSSSTDNTGDSGYGGLGSWQRHSAQLSVLDPRAAVAEDKASYISLKTENRVDEAVYVEPDHSP